jgi:hypothetical protein
MEQLIAAARTHARDLWNGANHSGARATAAEAERWERLAAAAEAELDAAPG